MFFKNWINSFKEQNKNEYLCETLMKDIRFDIGETFEDKETKRHLTVSYLHVKGNNQCIDLHIHLTEPLTQARQDEWMKETGKPLEEDDERTQEFYQKYYQEVEETLKKHFSYAVQIKPHVVFIINDTNKDKIDIEYSIHIEFNERILPLSRKVKKSIIKFKDYFLTRS